MIASTAVARWTWGREAGIWDDGDVGRVEEKLFMIGSLMTADYLSVELISFSDAWMPYNLRGGEQHDVYVLNSPRLTAALRGITEIVGEEVEPDDAIWFGIPTESGFVNHFYADGQAADTWRIFEIPYRNRVFRHVQGSGEASFARTATGEIRCVSVIRGDETLGYLWASDVGGAASFEPNDEPGDAGYSAGLHWLTLLDEARRRDTRPSDALKALSRLPSDPVGGKISWETMRTLPSFGELADLAGQPRSL